MANPPGSQLYNYDANGNAKMALVNGSGGFTTIANMAALQALAASSISDGQAFMLQTDGSLWRYASASALTTDTGGPFLVATATTAAVGAFLRVDKDVDITAAVTFATADAAVLYTVPVGFQLFLGIPFQHVTVSWTGGTSSAIGSSSSGGAMTTKGDLLGGSTGDVAATLVSTGAYSKGTIGTDMGKPGALLIGGDTILFDRITSVFTAGAGVNHYPVRVLLAPAA